MNPYVIMTDSSCDLPSSLAEELQLEVVPLHFFVDDVPYLNLLDGSEYSFQDTYAALREGKVIKTSSASSGEFGDVMRRHLEAGEDILYLGFSSGLSGTFNAGRIAAEELLLSYPDRKIYCVDTLCASLGQGLLLYHTVMKKREGFSLEQARDFAEENKLHLCHWFTVDDLMFLSRGGRITAATAAIGTVLGIKPVMHMDDEGHLTLVEKAKGRKKSFRRLLDYMRETGIDIKNQVVFLSHADCPEEASSLGQRIKEEFGVRDVIINYVGPVIGSHCGPGTISIFFLGTRR